MGSVDLDSLFPNLPLEKVIEIYAIEHLIEYEIVEDLSKGDLKELLSLATKYSHFIFDGSR